MRKIDKSKVKILSTEYKAWVDELNKTGKRHPVPNSKDRYYYDVVMNLLYCQRGACAYTEVNLVDLALLNKDKWENGRYKRKEKKKSGRFGDLEHFDHNLKKIKGYEWENLFVAAKDINNLKGEKEVDNILKPDSKDYSPFKLLVYNINTGCFSSNPDLNDKPLEEKIEYMLDILQVNHPTIVFKRRKFVKAGLSYLKREEPYDVYEFFTACRMAGVPVEDD